LCLSSSSALYFFQLFFSCPPPWWPVAPCTCNGLWILSRMAVSRKENIFFSIRIKLRTDRHILFGRPWSGRSWCTFVQAPPNVHTLRRTKACPVFRAPNRLIRNRLRRNGSKPKPLRFPSPRSQKSNARTGANPTI
jgi:hypothetical protein